MEGESSADRRGGRYHVILCDVIGEMTLSTCLLCRLLTQDENQSSTSKWLCRTLYRYRVVACFHPPWCRTETTTIQQGYYNDRLAFQMALDFLNKALKVEHGSGAG